MATKPRSAKIGARSVASRTLLRVVRQGAFASQALDAELLRHPQLSTADRALATELTYGVLRTWGGLEAELGRLAARGIDDEAVLVELLVAAYQIFFLDRVPAFAAVNAAVDAVRLARGAPGAGFANAVLRKLSGSTLDFERALRLTLPNWLADALARDIGREHLSSLLGATRAGRFLPPPLSVRFRRDRALPAWVSEAQPARWAPRAYYVKQQGDPRQLPGFAEGLFSVQEEGAQLVAHAVGVRAGERVWDACAGHGNKSAILAEELAHHGSGQLCVSDLHPKKLEKLALDFDRLRLPRPKSFALDLTRGTGALPGEFDRVLVDAPCTGTGTLRRRPELLRRLTPDAAERLAQLGESILRTAAGRTRAGGRVFYCVCSVLLPECEGVVARVSDLLEPVAFDAPALAPLLDRGAVSLRLLPHTHGTDGYFVASLRRR